MLLCKNEKLLRQYLECLFAFVPISSIYLANLQGHTAVHHLLYAQNYTLLSSFPGPLVEKLPDLLRFAVTKSLYDAIDPLLNLGYSLLPQSLPDESNDSNNYLLPILTTHDPKMVMHLLCVDREQPPTTQLFYICHQRQAARHLFKLCAAHAPLYHYIHDLAQAYPQVLELPFFVSIRCILRLDLKWIQLRRHFTTLVRENNSTNEMCFTDVHAWWMEFCQHTHNMHHHHPAISWREPVLFRFTNLQSNYQNASPLFQPFLNQYHEPCAQSTQDSATWRWLWPQIPFQRLLSYPECANEWFSVGILVSHAFCMSQHLVGYELPPMLLRHLLNTPLPSDDTSPIFLKIAKQFTDGFERVLPRKWFMGWNEMEISAVIHGCNDLSAPIPLALRQSFLPLLQPMSVERIQVLGWWWQFVDNLPALEQTLLWKRLGVSLENGWRLNWITGPCRMGNALLEISVYASYEALEIDIGATLRNFRRLLHLSPINTS